MRSSAMAIETYLPIAILLLLGVLFAGGSFLASQLMAPRRPTKAKSAPYECGIVPTQEPAQRFPVRFYLVAMIFIVFDIEIVFLYPWAVIMGDLQGFGLVEMVLFALSVIVALVYLVANGALDWGPVKRFRPLASPRYRSSADAIRRVGTSREPGGRAA